MHHVAIACIVLFAAAGTAHAQTPDDPWDQELADARYLNDVGAGLTVAGVSSVALGTVLWFGLGGWGAVIAAPIFWLIGGPLGLAGIPTWIVGAVRSNILAASDADHDRVQWSFELAGIVTTLAGIGITLLGGALMIGGMASVDGSGSRNHEIPIATGGIMIPIGFFTSIFIGTPLWAEAGRF